MQRLLTTSSIQFYPYISPVILLKNIPTTLLQQHWTNFWHTQNDEEYFFKINFSSYSLSASFPGILSLTQSHVLRKREGNGERAREKALRELPQCDGWILSITLGLQAIASIMALGGCFTIDSLSLSI